MAAFDPRSLRAYVEGGFEEQPDGTVRLRCRAADESRFYLMGAHHGASEHLGEVRCPTTVARGAPEPGPFDLAPAVAESVVDGTLVELPGVTHFGPMEDPALIAAEIRRRIT
jgi:pimeloyl-ACP methyl ester carboxylesterase